MGERRDDEARRGEVLDGTSIRVYGWGWEESGGRRGGLPWIGIFLVVFGSLLLLRLYLPELQAAGSLLFLALGLAFLISWAISRGTGALYAGAIITALAAPDLIQAAGVRASDGLGTFCLGVGFLAIAGVRAWSRGGVGWQALLGTALVLIGGSQMAVPGFSDVIWPLLVLGAGIALLAQSLRRR